MTTIDGPQPATAEDMKGIDWKGLEKMEETWRQQEARLKKLYLEHPQRKQFFEYDFVEALWFHTLEYYGKAIDDQVMEEMLNGLFDDDRLFQIVYDLASSVAVARGWEMK